MRSTTQNGDLDLLKCFDVANVQTIFKPTKKMDKKFEDLTHYTLIVDGEWKTEEYAQPFSESPLRSIEQTISKETLYGTYKGESLTNGSNLIGNLIAKVYQLLFKLQKYLLVKFLFRGESASTLHVACLYINNNVNDVVVGVPLYLTKVDTFKVVENGRHCDGFNADGVTDIRD